MVTRPKVVVGRNWVPSQSLVARDGAVKKTISCLPTMASRATHVKTVNVWTQEVDRRQQLGREPYGIATD